MKERSGNFPPLPDPFPRPADFLPLPATVEPDPPGAATAPAAAPIAEPFSQATAEAQEAAVPTAPPTGGIEQTASAAPDQETERVRLLGRAGRNPTLTERDDPRKTKATFPLAVRETTEKPTWHTIVAFGPRSGQVMATVKQGNSYEVVGYRHETPYTAKDGTPRVKREIYAARVIPR